MVCFVYLVDLVYLVSFLEPNKPDGLDKPNNDLHVLVDFINSLLVNQMMVDGIANQFGGSGELELVQQAPSIGTDGLGTEREGLRDLLDGLALSCQYENFTFSLR